MAPGTYTASAWGFSQVRQVPVTVTVSETEILSIDVDCDAAKETQWFLQSAIDNMIPRMLEYQSVTVDSITGATTSSGAIKLAVKDCLTQALKAAGTDESAIENFYVAQPKSTDVETIDVDVVVVGMGGTGTAAAMKTAELQKENGKEVSVLALEKAGTYGGTSSSTTSLLAFNSEKTIADYGESNYTDLDEIRQYLTDTGILGVGNKYAEWYWNDIFEVSGSLVDWLIGHGFYFGSARPGFWGKWSTQYYYCDSEGEDNLTEIHNCFDSMVADYVKLGGQYMTETEGYELIYDADSNTVTGVKARNLADGTEYIINAKAVIMATGGFGGNGEMMKEYNGGDYWLFGHEQNDGKMIQSALDIGAGTLGMNETLYGGVHNICTNPELHTFEYHFDEDGTIDVWRGDVAAWSLNDVPNIIVASYDSLWVTVEGKRAVNEALVWAWPDMGDTYYTIVDQNWIDNVAENGFTENHVELFCNAGYATFPLNVGIDSLEEGTTMQDILDACEEAGILVKADTVEELAEKLGMDASVLANTVSTYNQYCENGEDADFGKDPAYLTELTGGCYYAFKAAPRTYSSTGGLDVTDKLEVVKTDGETVINGLYAGGTDCLGATAPAFGGELQVWAYMSGYLAAEYAQEYIGQ
jgi:fumarate reductase flavoprotein subunit